MLDNLMDKVQEMLSDPESLKQIQELANMLNSEMENSQSTQDSVPPPMDNIHNNFQQSNQSSNNNNANNNSNNIDFGKIMQLMQLFNSTSDSKDTALLLAIKPYLTTERQNKVDKAIKLMKAYDIFMTAKNSGLLNNLDSFL